MNSLLIVTYVDFWRGGAGHRTRLSALINHLSTTVRVTVVYIGVADDRDLQNLHVNFPDITVDFLEKQEQLPIEQYIEKFAGYIQDKYFDFALLEYIEMYLYAIIYRQVQ